MGSNPVEGTPRDNHRFVVSCPLFMFSDGYVDQFDGPKGKKFMYSPFKQLLLDIQDKIMFDQKEILEHTLREWMGFTGLYEEEYEQIDDIIVMGIKV